MPFEKERGDYNLLEKVREYVQVKIPAAGGTDSIKDYRFNMCFDETTTQSSFFDESGVQAMLDRALEGYAATVFAYGQTGSGNLLFIIFFYV